MKNRPGNPVWSEKLYRQEASGLVLYGRALGLSHSEAEDVLHDTFVSLMALGRVPDEPVHYLLRSFRNRALNFKRSLWRRLRRELESSRWFERAAHETTQERIAMQCLSRLPVEQREVIVLKIWHDHTFDAIGRLLGISPHTVAGRYRYGMEKLRACLKGKNHESLESMGDHLAILDPSSAVEPS